LAGGAVEWMGHYSYAMIGEHLAEDKVTRFNELAGGRWRSSMGSLG
jgi:hypothetical protein